jgi:hypothetical protein
VTFTGVSGFQVCFPQVLQVTLTSEEIVMNPKFGNVSKVFTNSTYTGEVTMWFYRRIPSFKKLTLVESAGKVLVNSTEKPCDRKNIAKLKSLIQMAIGSPSFIEQLDVNDPPHDQVKCPTEIVSKLHYQTFQF